MLTTYIITCALQKGIVTVTIVALNEFTPEFDAELKNIQIPEVSFCSLLFVTRQGLNWDYSDSGFVINSRHITQSENRRLLGRNSSASVLE